MGNILTPAITFTSLSLIENVSWAATLIPEFITQIIEVSEFCIVNSFGCELFSELLSDFAVLKSIYMYHGYIASMMSLLVQEHLP